MRKLLLSCLLLIVAGSSAIMGQGGTVLLKGKITDVAGDPLPGAGITIDGTYLGTYADTKGDFTFPRLKQGHYQIRFSFIGYEQLVQQINIVDDTMLNIVLEAVPFMTDEVRVNATRAGEHTPLAYSMIDKSVLKKLNVGMDMPYLLGLTPSFVETSEAGNGVGYTSMRIRGTDANRINVTVDGIPLNDPESQQVFWVDLPDLASSVDNIQVQRGVGTSSNGAGAFGATLSIQTINPENEPGAEMSSSFGSFNTTKNTIQAGTGLLADKFAFIMRYSDVRSDGYIDRTGSRHRSAFLSGVYRTERSRLKANIILGEEHTGIGWWGVPKDSLQTNRTYNPEGQYTDEYGRLSYYDNSSDNYKQDHFQLIYSYKAGENLNLDAALHYTRGKGYYEEYRDDQELMAYQMSPVSIGGEMITSSDLIRRKWLDNDFYGMVYSLDYRKDRARFVLGGGLNKYLGDHYGTVIWMRNAGNSEKDYEWYFNNSVKSEFSVYGKMNYSITDKLNFFGDLQYRFIFYRMLGFEDDLTDISQGHRFGFFNPKTGLFWSVNPNNDAWLSFSVANREPTREDFKEASGDPEATPNPETLYDAEAGYKHKSERFSFAATLYGMFYKDQLVPTGQLSDVGYPIMTNVDKSYRLGLELTGAMKITGYLDWKTSLTLSRNKIRDFVEYYTDYISATDTTMYLNKNLGLSNIAYSPNLIWSSDLYAHKGIFGLHLISKFVGKQYFDNTMNDERSIDPYFVNNMWIEVSPAVGKLKDVHLQFMVNNLFNEVYENNAYGGNWYEDGVEKTWSYYFPQAGRNFMLRLNIKF